MKKLIFLLSTIALLSACSNVEKIADTNEYTIPESLDITMSIDETEITNETDSLTLAYKYIGTDDDVMYGFGCDYTLERFENGNWYIVPFSENAMFDELGYLLGSESPTQFTDVSLRSDFYDEPLTEGLYRVVKPIGDITLTAEFEIK